MLANFVNSNLPEYQSLLSTDKEHLVQEFNEHQVDKVVGVRMMMKGKVGDVTQTLKAIEEEVALKIPLMRLC